MKRLISSAAVFLFVACVAGSGVWRAEAAELTVELAPDGAVIAGQPSVLSATVTDGGQPAAGISVTFYSTETFARVTGDAEIGRAVTDAQGTASITYKPGEAGSRDVRAEATAKDGTVTNGTATITIEGSPEQQYVQTAGVQVPGLNVWLIMGVLAIVWGTLLFIAVTVVRIAAAGEAGGAPEANAGNPGAAR